ncbi:MAG TPA: PSD1 and planctomycete cytochrome C domain-containing protein [Opitutus sp.]|nr:PSD1 and planctomycete cytochrome C domain-containing protein [Opitutus sp.]
MVRLFPLHFLLPAIAAFFLAGCARDKSSALDGKVAAPARIDFNKHIRPILNQNCTACHGGGKMAGGISFIYRELATRTGESGRLTIVPGKPEKSEMIARVTSKDEEFRMPKPEHGPRLSDDEIALLRQWISEGAEWSEHWAFVPPKPQTVPEVKQAASAPTPIDRFVVARLEREGLAPAPAEDRATLLRRVSLDLTGLPPTAAETQEFLASTQPDAYEQVIERFLASPHFGERWATVWLDLARYADSKGYEKDGGRMIWPYRDWLIDALNRNLPYDRFLVEQLAGDLLPNATIDQRIATAFHRNTQTNDEGGTDDEEFRIAALLDRTATTWLATNGVTFNCVQCHAHPYDPIKHEEYYRFAAFFNNSRDTDLDNEHPVLRVAEDPERRDEVDRLQRQLREVRERIHAVGRDLADDENQWVRAVIAAASSKPAASFELRNGAAVAVGAVNTESVFEFRIPTIPADTAALRLEVFPENPAIVRHSPEFGFVVKRIDGAIVLADGTEAPVVIRRFFADTANQFTDSNGPPPAPRPPDPKKPAPPPPPPPLAPGYFFAANPTVDRTRWIVAVPESPLTLPPGATLVLRLKHDAYIASKSAPARRVRVATSCNPQWTAAAGDPDLAAADATTTELMAALNAIPHVRMPVMEELPENEHREMLVYGRGNYLIKEGEPLEPGVPELFPPLPADAPPNRLTLAEWFVAPGHPLTSRVAVNRFWEQLFGTGIVETLEDFGSVGEPPSHPELLDWLALRFERELRWDVKALLRELVTSATYRQSARMTPATFERDPRNRLLARGPRNRLTAEMVRDQALAASGLLSHQLHGPPVMPPQPEGVWAAVYSDHKWIEATGPDRYRRAIYTYLRRSAPYPSFLTFDAPAREACTLRRSPTNTPLQSLVTLNDPVFVEAAIALGDRMFQQTSADLREQVSHGFQLVATRKPTEGELAPLVALYVDSLQLLETEAQLPYPVEAPELQRRAFAAVASAMLNLDCVLTK